MENKRIITEQNITEYRAWLVREEKSRATMEKYLRDVREFCAFACNREVTKELAIEWKESLMAGNYAAATINSKLAGLGSLLGFLDGRTAV